MIVKDVDLRARRFLGHALVCQRAVCDRCGAPATEWLPSPGENGEWEAGLLRARAQHAGFVNRIDERHVTILLCPLCAAVHDGRSVLEGATL